MHLSLQVWHLLNTTSHVRGQGPLKPNKPRNAFHHEIRFMVKRTLILYTEVQCENENTLSVYGWEIKNMLI